MNNIAYYGLDPLELVQRTSSLLWSDVDESTWTALKSTGSLNGGFWNYVVALNFYTIIGNNLKEIYKTYTGTNKIVLDTSTNRSLMLSGYQYTGYLEIESVTKILDAL